MCVCLLTVLGLVLLVAVDQEVAWALRAEGQQDTLPHRRDEGEAQQQGPQLCITHNTLHTEDLHKTPQMTLIVHFFTNILSIKQLFHDLIKKIIDVTCSPTVNSSYLQIKSQLLLTNTRLMTRTDLVKQF